MSDCVLDASALIANFKGELRAPDLDVLLNASLLSAVNYVEVLTVMMRNGISIDHTAAIVVESGTSIIPFDSELAETAARLSDKSRAAGLSLGDRACLALALRENLPVYTADRAWKGVDVGVEIRFIR